jgi:5-methylcytosine-specific restriction endonuclease McrA
MVCYARKVRLYAPPREWRGVFLCPKIPNVWEFGKGVFILLAHPSHMTKKQIYKDPRYLRARAAALARDKYLCQECRRYGRTTPAQTAHHIKHVEDYPELAFDENNLKSVCWSCHNKEHPEKGGNRGRGSRSRNRGDYE